MNQSRKFTALKSLLVWHHCKTEGRYLKGLNVRVWIMITTFRDMKQMISLQYEKITFDICTVPFQNIYLHTYIDIN